MSAAKIHKAIFERPLPVEDDFNSQPQWQLVCEEWVSLEPLSGRELLLAQQMQSQTTHKSYTTFSPSTAQINSQCRMKIAKVWPENEQDPSDDANFRIFQLESAVNVREQNREIELRVIERT
jgi:head-tail adaptor